MENWRACLNDNCLFEKGFMGSIDYVQLDSRLVIQRCYVIIPSRQASFRLSWKADSLTTWREGS